MSRFVPLSLRIGVAVAAALILVTSILLGVGASPPTPSAAQVPTANSALEAPRSGRSPAQRINFEHVSFYLVCIGAVIPSILSSPPYISSILNGLAALAGVSKGAPIHRTLRYARPFCCATSMQLRRATQDADIVVENLGLPSGALLRNHAASLFTKASGIMPSVDNTKPSRDAQVVNHPTE